jgi:hypothetical protein
MARILIAIAMFSTWIACAKAPFTPAQCDILVKAAASLSVRITETVEGKEKAELVAEYAAIVANIGDVGCDFVPVD